MASVVYKYVVPALVWVGVARAQEQPAPSLTAWKYSVVTVLAAEAADIRSSVGEYELNPMLGNGSFGARQASIKVGMVGGGLLLQAVILRKHPKAAKALKWINFASSGAVGYVAWNNFSADR